MPRAFLIKKQQNKLAEKTYSVVMKAAVSDEDEDVNVEDVNVEDDEEGATLSPHDNEPRQDMNVSTGEKKKY